MFTIYYEKKLMDNTRKIHQNPNTKIFSDERNEFGLFQFKEKFIQEKFQEREDQYAKTRDLKYAFDNQELLCKMIDDVTCEYQKRMQQLTHLQKNAFVEFREAKLKYKECTKSPLYGLDGVEIGAPQTIDPAKINLETEFQIFRSYHNTLRLHQEKQIVADEARAQQLLDEQKRQDEARAKWSNEYYEAQAKWFSEWVLDKQKRLNADNSSKYDQFNFVNGDNSSDSDCDSSDSNQFNFVNVNDFDS